jgi:hypothetical protein
VGKKKRGPVDQWFHEMGCLVIIIAVCALPVAASLVYGYYTTCVWGWT